MLKRPVLEAAAEPVDGGPLSARPVERRTLVSVMSDKRRTLASGVRGTPGPTHRASADALPKYVEGLSAQWHPVLHPRLHTLGRYPPYLPRDVDLVPGSAPGLSPERAAVRTRNRKHSLAAMEAWDASTVLSASPTS